MFGSLLVAEMSKAHFEVKMYKAHHVRTTFGSWGVEKGTPLWREDARSTFASQNVQNTPFSDHFCIDVEKVHTVVARSTFASQKWKKWEVRRTCGRSDVVLRGRRRGLCTWSKVSKMWGFVAVSTTITTTLHYTTRHDTTLTTLIALHYIYNYNYNYNYHYVTLHYTTPHHPTLHYTNYITLRYTTLHYTTLDYTTLHSVTLHYTTLHHTTLH